MSIVDSDSAILYTGGGKVYKGIEYANLSGTGNSIIPSESVGISINRCPFVVIPAFQPLLVASTYTYSFAEDTTLLFGNFVVPDFYITTVEYSAVDVPLVKNVESVSLVSITDREGKEVTSGTVATLAYVYSDENGDKAGIIRLYGNTLGLIQTSNVTIQGKEYSNLLSEYTISTPIPAGEILSFTLEADSDKIDIMGTQTPSQIRLVRRNL